MKRRIWGIILCMLMLVGILPLSNVQADQDNRTVKIGYIDYDGFITENIDGSYSGYGVDYLNKVSEYTGWNYEFVYGTWDNLMKDVLDGKIDILCQAQITDERKQTYLFSKYAIGTESSVLYARSDDERYYFNDYSHFNGMKIAVLKNSFQADEIREYANKKDFSCDFIEYNTQDECFAALDGKQVDAVAMGSLAIKTDYKVICKFGADAFYCLTDKSNEALMDELDDALAMINTQI